MEVGKIVRADERRKDETERRGESERKEVRKLGSNGNGKRRGGSNVVDGMKVDYDSPWKEVLETYFQEFLIFFFPAVYDGIDWSRGYEFLDKELQQLDKDGELGRRLVDKLVKVWRRDGEVTLVLVHVEVQGQVDRDFTKRMYVYNYRLFDKHGKKVVSLAVLADEHPDWRPRGFGYELWGCKVNLEFPMVKLLDYEERWDDLERSLNPFAVVVMAHLRAQLTRNDPEGRFAWKLTLSRKLYERGYGRKEIMKIFRFIDWLMVLPKELGNSFTEALRQFEKEKKMRYVTSIERQGIEKGMQQGTLQKAREDVLDILEVRFGTVPQTINQAISASEDLSLLKVLLKKAALVVSLGEFEEITEKTLPH